MPLQIPTRADEVSRLQAYVRTNIPELDPTVTTRRGFIGGMVKSLGSAIHDWYVALKRYADYEPFPQTATGKFLTTGWWTNITGLPRNPAAEATGRAVVTGTAGTVIPANTVVNSGVATYKVDSAAAIVAQSLNISSLIRSGTTAIAETNAPHYLATGMSVTISGADQSDYNVTAEITVTGDNEFTFEVSGSPTTPATGTIKASGTWGNIDLTADETGPDSNVDGGGTVSFATAPSGAVATIRTCFAGIDGGTDIEPIEDYRARILEALGTDFGMFSASEIKIVAKQVPGVTRVWVQEATLGGTNGVNEGQVKIYFMRDNDANPFPSSNETSAVRDYILDTMKPAHTAPEDVMVYAPTQATVDIEISAMSPDTTSMRQAIQARLEQLFDEGVDLGRDVSLNELICAIHGTFDAQRQQTLVSFTLDTPSATVSIDDDELPVLGTITWPSITV